MRKARTPFDILGVTPADDMTAIRMAWRAKVRVLHPDFADDKDRATQVLARINAAFDALQGHIPKVVHGRKPANKRQRPETPAVACPERSQHDLRCRGGAVTPQAKGRARPASRNRSTDSIRLRAISGYAKARRAVSPAQK